MRRVVRSVLLLAAACLAAASPCAAGTAELLADLYQGSSNSGFSGVREPLVSLGERVVFEAAEASSGTELWVSDGTPLGTRLLRDLAPGDESTDFRPLGTVGRTAVFLRDLDFGVGPFDLWRSDGTAAGTSLLYGLAPLDGCSFQEMPEAVTVAGRLFFLARTDTVECGLWSTDGTAAGTRLVQDVESEGHDLAAVGSRVFFATADGGLWVSNGSGAVRVKSFAGSFGDEAPRRLTAVGSRIAFLAHESAGSGEELWISDGTGAGTRAVTQFFDPLPFGAQPLLKAIGNVLYFTADDGTGVDLWQSDGGAPGTSGAAARRVTDFIDREPFLEPFGADELVRLGGRLVFPSREGGGFRQRLWTSDGTPGGTRVLDGCPAGCPALFPTSFAQLGSRIVFVGYDSRDQPGPWVTDGTAAGTRRLADTAVSFVPVPLLGRVFFAGSGGTGSALWKTDGTPAGTLRLADLGSSPFGGGFDSRFAPVAAGGRIFFAASPELSDSPQLWASDGSAAGTRVISDLKTSLSSAPGPFAPFAGGTLFGAQDGSARRSLWRTDGTAAGTLQVRAALEPLSIVTSAAPASGGVAFVLSRRERFSGPFEVWRTDGTAAGTSRIEPSGGGQVIDGLASFGDGAVFVVEREDHRLSLWESDGSGAGTHALLTLPAAVADVHFLQAVGSALYFIGSSAEGIEELWVSDGTAAGTRPVATERELDFVSAPVFVPFGGAVFFADQFGLWRTDGTAAGTSEVLSTEWDESRPTDLTECNGVLYFMAGLPEAFEERGLWRTAGTPAGTFLVRPVSIPAESSLTDPVRMVRLGGRLVFLADDGEHGAELWASDGTAAGTAMVRDIAPGAASSPLPRSSLTVAGGKVYFTATDGASGFELWESDGTASGTRRVQDIAPGALSSSPADLTASGNRLFFAADDGVHGEEPWALTLSGGCVPSDTALCLGGRFRVEADWRDFQGHRGRGHAAALTGDTGTFWFFDAANVEVILKVLDGRGINDHHWVFYGALSNVEYTLTVTDTQSGAVRRYFNPRGWLGSLADTEAFGPRGASVAGVVSEGPVAQRAETPAALRSAAVPGNCVPGAEQLCLQGNRFAVKVSWKRPNGATGTGKAVPLAGGDTGYFWFFDAGNVELVVKVLDGRPLNGKLWVFFGALSDVEYTLTVTDTQTGAMKTYKNPAGRLASVADTGAF